MRDGLDDITSPKDYAAGVMERTTYLYRITKESREDQGVYRLLLGEDVGYRDAPHIKIPNDHII